MKYVGISDNVPRRMKAHRSKKGKFRGESFEYQIIYQSLDLPHIEEMEEYFILEYDSFWNGLNRTEGGKAWGHNSPNFTTRGFRFSEDSKRKMSISAQRRIERDGAHRCKHSEQQKQKWSESRKGKIHSSKLSDEQVREIRTDYEDKVQLKTPFVTDRAKRKKGVFENYDRAFAHEYGMKYNITLQNCLKIIRYVSFKHVRV